VDGRSQENSAPSPDEIDSRIIHYHYDPDEKWSPYENTNDIQWFWYILITLLLVILIILFSAIIFVQSTKKNIMDNITRKRIYDTIKETQGIHFRDLMKKVEIKQGVLGYHLNILEEEGYIKSIQRGNKRCFFTRDDKGDFKLKLNMAQQRILNEININPGISLKDLAKVTSKTPTLVYYHTSILMDAGLIEKEREGRGSHFFVSVLGRGYVS
jgi:predicted transcriptional regulator